MPPTTLKLLKRGRATTCSGPLQSRDTRAVAGPLAEAPMARDSDSERKPAATAALASGGKTAMITPATRRQRETCQKCSSRRCAECATR